MSATISRKHFVAIAEIIAANKNDARANDLSATAQMDRVARDMATYLKSENVAFDRQRFLDACASTEATR